jgi:hypothetical protein
MAMSMKEDYSERVGGSRLELSSTVTTIDPSVVQSRIRQSASLQTQDTAMEDDSQPVFPKLSAAQAAGNKVEYRRIRCPTHRYTPLREHWEQILTPLVEYLKLQVRKRTIFRPFISKRKLLRRKIYPLFGTISVLFLEIQTLWEASMYQGMKWDDYVVV